jgi:hypothetical protein
MASVRISRLKDSLLPLTVQTRGLLRFLYVSLCLTGNNNHALLISDYCELES